MIGFEDLVMFWDLTVAFSQCRLDFFFPDSLLLCCFLLDLLPNMAKRYDRKLT